MKNKMKIAILVGVCLLASACGVKNVNTKEGTLDGITFKETEEETNYVKITMENNDMMLLELYPDVAPITVENFKKLVQEKYYDGLIFHRVVKDFMIQGGAGADTPMIKGEFGANGFTNLLKHTRGVISMARANDMDSASGQFFIVHKDSPHLNGQYAGFGEIIAGISTVDKIAEVATDANDVPLKNQKMKSIRFVEIEK